MAGGMRHTGGLTTPAPGAEEAKLVILIPMGLPCLERGLFVKKWYLEKIFFQSFFPNSCQPGYWNDLAGIAASYIGMTYQGWLNMTWTDNTSITYVNWDTNEINGSSPCAIISPWYKGWLPGLCSIVQQYVCQKEGKLITA